jgi:glycosyltransferase involved in cell wall biosynthesis
VRALFLVDHASTSGGAERLVAGLATHLPRDRIEPWVCSTRHGEPAAVNELREAGIPYIELNRRATWQVYRLWPLAALLRTKRIDVVHSHMFGSNMWGTLIGRACRVPVILAHEHNWSYEGAMRMWLDGHVIGRLATRFITVSAANRERMITLEGVPADKVQVMPTAYIPHPGPPSDIRAELGIPAAAPLVGTAAVVRAEKRLDVLLDAFALLRARVADAHLVIAGDGPCSSEVEQHVEHLGLDGSVHLLGRRRDVDSILRGADVGAMSSDWEGMPLFTFECMANDTPLVATAVGGLTEVVRDGETGLLVAPGDPGALAVALERVLTDRPFARRLAANAATRLGEYEINAVAAQFADLYEQLLADARSR